MKAFSNKPCFGVCNESQLVDLNDVVEQEFPTKRYVSRECTLWSVDTYENSQNFYPAVCQSCKNILPKEEWSKYEERIESSCESQGKEELHPAEMLKVDLDSELTKSGIEDEDFSEMHPDGENIASNTETESGSFLKPECELEHNTKNEANDSDTCQKEVQYAEDASSACSICNLVLSQEEYLTHFEEYHSEVQLGCPKCPSTFSSPDLLRNHYKQFHHNKVKAQHRIPEDRSEDWDEEQMNIEGGSPLPDPLRGVGWGEKTCKVCGKTFSKPNNLRKHMVVHEDARPFRCSHCGKAFKQKAHLKKHGEKKKNCGLFLP